MSKKPNVFIRGVYSTALTKLFIDAGFPIIFPSAHVQKRFNIPFRPVDSYSKDITIKDRLDRQGITIMFKKDIWQQLEENNFKDFPLTHEKLPNLIIFNARFHKNSIFRGMSVQSNSKNNYSFIRLTPEEINTDGAEKESSFSTTLGRFSRFLEEGKEGIFQVTHEDNGKIRASLGSYYTIPGDLIVINPFNTRVIISKEIMNGKQKKRLFDLGKEIQKTKKYGYIFRTAAELATDEEILEEVDRLEGDLIKTQEIITKFPDRIGEIYCNHQSMNILFTAEEKTLFDNIRDKLVATVNGHHGIKSVYVPRIYTRPSRDRSNDRNRKGRHVQPTPAEGLTGKMTQLMDYTEELLAVIPKDGHAAVKEFYLEKYFTLGLKPNAVFQINHQKLGGKVINLSSGLIKRIHREKGKPIRISLRRRLREGGMYDGLNTPIERGDYAISQYELGSWYYVSTYYGQDGGLKGRYININTPLEITHHGLHYFDLEIDVVENMVGDRKIIDKEYLEKALEMKIISQPVFDKAVQLAEDIKSGKLLSDLK